MPRSHFAALQSGFFDNPLFFVKNLPFSNSSAFPKTRTPFRLI